MSTENHLRDSASGTPGSSSTLSELFDKGFEAFNKINITDEPTNSSKVQADVRRTMTMLEDATKLVSLVDMFSANESLEDVPTENLKYFLLPALLGTLATKICDTNNRMHIVNVAEIYFIDFLKRVKEYGLTDIEIPEVKTVEGESETSVARPKSNAELITEMVSRRNTKLQRYREQKELQSRLEVLGKNYNNPNIDDETKRDYFLTLLKLYVTQAIDELGSLAAEKPILEHMKHMEKSESASCGRPQKQKIQGSKLQPVIITRDEVQKKVYGAGYPSLPVLTVQEFYDQKIKEGDWPDPSQYNEMSAKCLQDMVNNSENPNLAEDKEAAEKDEKIDIDDPELLERTRAMDEYKDTHKRGWGNRYNRS